jgi:hypothetical protein
MRTFASLAICLSFVACKHHESAPPPSPQEPASMVPDTQGVPGSTNLQGLAQLAPMMSTESTKRAAVKVPVEKLFDSLAQHGVAVANQHQVLARTAGASYCMLGVTEDTVAIAACEYPTHDAAVAGQKLLDDHYRKLVPDAVREINGSTLVTVANADHHAAVRDRVFQTFRAL